MSDTNGAAAAMSQPPDLLTSVRAGNRLAAFRALPARVAVPAVLLLLCAFVLMAGPLVWTQSPLAQNLGSALRPPVLFGGTWEHPLGTDQLGRDILARTLAGGQSSLFLAMLATVGAGVIGVLAGLLSGYFGGWIDRIFMRIADIQLAFPTFLLALAILAAVPAGMGPLLSVMILSGWVLFARVVRGLVRRMREASFIEASRGAGASFGWIVRRHILPNIGGTIIVLATIVSSEMIILQAGLSFLGLGMPPPAPSWGAALSEGVPYLVSEWWLAAMPGFSLMVVILLTNVLGDALRDLLNPALRVRGR